MMGYRYGKKPFEKFCKWQKRAQINNYGSYIFFIMFFFSIYEIEIRDSVPDQVRKQNLIFDPQKISLLWAKALNLFITDY